MSGCQSDYYACTRAYDERDCATTRSICQMQCSLDSFGAIAYSQETGAYGWSFEYRSRQAAENAALGSCRERQDGTEDCRILAWFRSACGALALDPDGTYGADWGHSKADATEKALAVCAEHGGQACEIEKLVCSR